MTGMTLHYNTIYIFLHIEKFYIERHSRHTNLHTPSEGARKKIELYERTNNRINF